MKLNWKSTMSGILAVFVMLSSPPLVYAADEELDITGTAAIQEVSESESAGDFIISDDGVLSEYKGTDAHMVIPDGVKTIGSGSTLAKPNGVIVTEVTIPASVTKIEKSAFRGWGDLHQINFSEEETLKTIGDGAFVNVGIPELVIPEGVETIGGEGALAAKDVVSIALPSTVTQLGGSKGAYEAFCTNSVPSTLTNVTVAAENPVYSARNQALYNAEGDTLLYCASGVGSGYEMDNQTKSIGSYAFYKFPSASVIISDSVETIESHGFDSSQLTSLLVPASVKTIGTSAFFNNSKLKTVDFAEGLSQIGASAFSECYFPKDTRIVLPVSLASVGASAFDCLGDYGASTIRVSSGETQLSSGFIPSYNAITVEGIAGSTAEAYVKELQDSKGSSCKLVLTQISAGQPTEVESIALNQQTLALTAGSTATLTADVLPESAANAELNWTSLNEAVATVNQSGVVTAVAVGEATIQVASANGKKASCTVTVSSASVQPGFDIESGVLVAYTGSDTEITIPNTVQVIGNGSSPIFASNQKVTAITIPSSVTKIADKAFYSCADLTEVKFSAESHLNQIGQQAFYLASGIQALDIPEGVAEIGPQAFVNMHSLESMSLPASLSTWGNSNDWFGLMFSLNTSSSAPSKLRAIHIAAGNPVYSSQDGMVYTGNGKTLLYSPAKKTSISFANGVEVIGKYAFNKNELTTLSIPETVKEIQSYAFYGAALTSLTVPGSVETIGDSAFYNSQLRSLLLSEGVQTIGNSAFSQSRISGVTIPATVTRIGKNAFDFEYGGSYIRLLNGETELADEFIPYYESIKVYGTPGSTAEQYITAKKIEKNVACKLTFCLASTFADAESLLLSQVTAILDRQETLVLTASLQPEGAVGPAIAWRSSDLSVATVDSKGKITGIQPGEADIIATSGLLSAVCHVSVKSSSSDYVVNEKGEITAYLGNDWTNLIIPSQVDGAPVTGIADGVFSGKTSIQTVQLPDSLKTIGKEAFYGCSALKSVTFGSGVVSLGSGAFAVCNGLTSIMLPEGIQQIPEKAFLGCLQLSSVTLPSTVKELGTDAFSGCVALTALNLPEGLETIRKGAFFKCPLTTLHLPASLNQFGDSYIGDVFEEAGKVTASTAMKTITVASGSTKYSAYDGLLYNKAGTETYFCPRGRTEANLRSGTVKVGDSTFFMCFDLTKVTFPSTLKEIGEHAFQYCEGLVDCELPEGLETVGNSAFFGCENWTGVDRIPSTVKTIGPYGFAECKGSILVIPEGVQRIESYAFWGYEEGLTEIHLPSTLTYIADSAFSWAKDVTSLVVPEGVTEIGAQAFARMDRLEEVTLPPTLVKLGAGAFMGPSQSENLLKEVYIPSSVQTFGDKVFENRTADLTIVTDRMSNAAAAYALASQIKLRIESGPVDPDFDIVDGVLVAYHGSKSELVIPEGVVEIGPGAFQHEHEGEQEGPELKKVTIPATVVTISREAFHGCALTEVIFLPGSQLKTIGESAFAYCTKLPSISLPEGVTSIGDRAFDGDSLLSGMVIPASVETIGAYAFNVCTGLRSITFGDSGNLRTIGAGAFYNCFRLSALDIPEGVTEIGDNAFRISSGLKTLNLPSTLVKLGTSVPTVFCDTTNITYTGADALMDISIAVGNPVYSSMDGVVYSADGKTLLYCPAGKIGTLTVQSGTIKIDDYAFYRSQADHVELPDTLLTIGKSAWANSKLSSIVIPDSVQTIGDHGFFFCGKLKTVKLGSGLDTLGAGVFSQTPLKGVTIPASVKGITTNTFDELTGWIRFLGTETVLEADSLSAGTVLTVYGYENSSAQNYVSQLQAALGDSCKLTFQPISKFIEVDSLTLNETSLSLKQRETSQLTATVLPDTATHRDVVYQTTNSRVATVSQEGTVTALQPGTAIIRALSTDGPSVDCAVTVIKDESISDFNLNAEGYITGYVGDDTNLVIPSTVNGRTVIGIGPGAFRNNWNIRSVSFPDTLTIIGDRAFESCKNLSEVNFGSGLREIGVSAFHGCTDLSVVSLPDGLETMGAEAFAVCEKLEHVRIPGSLKTIPESAFETCWRLREVHLPEGVENIGRRAFYECEGMELLTLPTSLRVIGEGSFTACVRLQEVIIPEGVTTIGQEAFMSCTALTSLQLPSTLETLGSAYPGDVFEQNASVLGCNQLKTVTVAEGNPYFSSYDGLLYTADGTELLFCPRGRISASVKEGTVKIGTYAFFFCRQLQEVSLPKSLRELDKGAFSISDRLISLTLPEGLERIGMSALADCASLKTLVIPGTVKEIGTYAISSTGLETLTIPNGVQVLGENALASNSLLKTVHIPASVSTIGKNLLRSSDKATIWTTSADTPIYSYAKDNSIPVQITGGTSSGKSSGSHSTKETVNQGQKDNVLTPSASMDGKGQGSAKLTTEEVKQAIEAVSKNSSLEVVIQPAFGSTLSKAVVILQGKSVASIAEDTSADLKIEMKVGSVTIPNNALTSISSQALGDTITFSMEAVKESSLTAEQQKLVNGNTVYDISVLSGDKPISNFGGKTITILLPYTLKAGESAEGVAVWYLSDSGKLEKLSCRYDSSTGMVRFTTNHLSAYVVGYEETWQNPFSDVKTGDWYYTAVEYALKNNLFKGTNDRSFSPQVEMTRAMLATVLYRMEGQPAVTDGTRNFQDVKAGQWYTDAVTWAAANGIADGYGDGFFGVDSNVSREQMAAILYRYAGYKKYDVTGNADLSAFTDAAKIDSWAKPAMQWAGAEGLINGTTAETLSPEAFATRAQVAAVLMRFAENTAK
ncbi:leucine-rich repeat protein [Aminipila butyrica]|uniref:Leucine-rich repeat protein n=1 Tax=Aminipila butyrica TaxID=433296 RepID=A0A858BRJ1_9FIRM|nr:leucine-rich repeat protein [Aminipila butyrica]QIB68551.1 leucine-rich repeat protein [Aminipila butyrica]